MFGAKTLKDTKYDHFHTNLSHLKPLNKLIKKILRILQTKKFVKLIICINSKGCIEIADA